MSYSQRQEKSHSLPINTLQVSKLKMKIYTGTQASAYSAIKREG